jgi:branched-chain amino acid transport system substrate-binding protein
MLKNHFKHLALPLALSITLGSAQATEPFKIAVIDPLSGPAAGVTERIVKVLNFSVKALNEKGGLNGAKVEVLTFDNKMSPQETTIQAQKAIDAGARILQTSVSSSNTFALIDFVKKYNQRNPDKKVIVFDAASGDPAVTAEKCDFYTFSGVLNSAMKTRGLASFVKGTPDIKKIYLLNAEGSSGQTSRQLVLEAIKAARPDIAIVGDDSHALQKISDFTPYIAKIRAAGADAVITSDWGADLALVLKAAGETHLKAKWLTYFTTGPGAPTAIRQAGLEHLVYSAFDGDAGISNADNKKNEQAFRATESLSIGPFPGNYSLMKALAAAAEKAGSNQVDALAWALEGIGFKTVYGADATLRADDHQIITPMVVSSFGPIKVGGLDEEGTGWGWQTQALVPAASIERPASCHMQRPAKASK